jgi:hypothetical protein|tara:strand:+ start:757 stop:915 length:159 start_codon:yes stop_codon:yes gene_type:complete
MVLLQWITNALCAYVMREKQKEEAGQQVLGFLTMITIQISSEAGYAIRAIEL